MPILDLISPWAHAIATQDARELRRFRERHSTTLNMIRRQRAPLLPELPAPASWKPAIQRAGDSDVLGTVRATRDRMVEAGFREPAQIVLVASAVPGPVAEVIPGSDNAIVLFLDRDPVVAPPAAPMITTALAAAIAILTRWTDPGLGNPIARIAAQGPWDKWQAAREVPLAEWIYAAGIGVHAMVTHGSGAEGPGGAASRAVLAAPLQMPPADHRRLRTVERDLQVHLDADLDHTGAGLLMRWLDDGAPPAMRRCADGFVVPPGAGRYLGWRMLEERVARVGVLEAAMMGA